MTNFTCGLPQSLLSSTLDLNMHQSLVKTESLFLKNDQVLPWPSSISEIVSKQHLFPFENVDQLFLRRISFYISNTSMEISSSWTFYKFQFVIFRFKVYLRKKNKNNLQKITKYPLQLKNKLMKSSSLFLGRNKSSLISEYLDKLASRENFYYKSENLISIYLSTSRY